MRIKALFQRHETTLFLAIVAFGVVITIINPSFFTLENLFDLIKSYAFMGVFAVGVLFVLISGGIDISFSAIATVGEYVMTVIMIRHGGNIATCFLISCGIGVALGLINALLIYNFNIPTIITTIATLNIFYGILTVLSGGKWIYNLPSWFQEFAIIRVFTLTSAEGIPYGLSIITVLWAFVVVVAWLILRYTTLGRALYAMGGSITSARRAGLNILRLQLFVYSFMGLMSGIAGVIQALLVQSGKETFSLPLGSVLEVVRVRTSEISTIHGREVIRLRDSVLPIARLERVLNVAAGGERGEWIYVVVVGVAEKKLGIIVDGLTGQKEVVIKSLGAYLHEVSGIAGSTILGDGTVIMILDIAEFMNLFASMN